MLSYWGMLGRNCSRQAIACFHVSHCIEPVLYVCIYIYMYVYMLLLFCVLNNAFSLVCI